MAANMCIHVAVDLIPRMYAESEDPHMKPCGIMSSTRAHLGYGLCCSADNAGQLREGEANRPVLFAVLALLAGYEDRYPAAPTLSAT